MTSEIGIPQIHSDFKSAPRDRHIIFYNHKGTPYAGIIPYWKLDTVYLTGGLIKHFADFCGWSDCIPHHPNRDAAND